MHLYTKPHKHILHTRTLTHKSFHVRMFSPTEAFTHRKLWHASFSHTNAFTPGNLQVHMRLHAGTFTHGCRYTPELPATAFTNKQLLHKGVCMQKLLRAAAFTQKLLTTDAFTHRPPYAHRWFYTQNASTTICTKKLWKKNTFLPKSSKIHFCYNISVCKHRFRPSNLDLRGKSFSLQNFSRGSFKIVHFWLWCRGLVLEQQGL